MHKRCDAVKNSWAQNQPARARPSLPASMSEPAASAAQAKAKAFRTKPCRFWEQRSCLKGDACAFAHVDVHGTNWHAPIENRSAHSGAQELQKRNAESVAVNQEPGSSATASAKRLKLQMPGEQHGDGKQRAHADARSDGQGSNPSQDTLDSALFSWPAKKTGDIHKWLHEERSVRQPTTLL